MAINYSEALKAKIEEMLREKLFIPEPDKDITVHFFDPNGKPADLTDFIVPESLTISASEYSRGGMAPSEPDPLDELLNAAGVGKEAGLPPRANRSYITRTIDFEVAQKESRKRLAKFMETGEKMSERQLEYKCDPRPGYESMPSYYGMYGVDYNDEDDDDVE